MDDVRIAYEDLADRLTPEAQTLYREMVAAHLEAGKGDRIFTQWDAMQGSGLTFVNHQGVDRRWENLDVGAVHDLLSYGLLSIEYGARGTPNYRISGEGLAFYRWLMARLGSAVDQVNAEARRVVEGDDFARKHPGSAHHLRAAFALLWRDQLDDQTVSEFGDHLRKALFDIVSDVVGPEPGKQEQPIKRLQAWMEGRSMADREREVVTALVELARVTLRLDHRLNHIRDEADASEPAATQSELRRAAFVTTLVCEQLAGA